MRAARREFKPIEGAQGNLQQAVNTDKDIIKFGDVYYMCFQAVWFMSKSPTGPWDVASSIPKEIYTIPTSSPVNHVTYVTVEDNDDEWVTFAYAAAYTGLMIGWGCVVWGSGWYYPPYGWYGGFYPGYYPYPHTYGMGAWYNPYTGAYRSRLRGLRSVRRRRRRLVIQPAHRHLRARRRGVRSRRIALVRPGVQPAHGDLRADASGLERLRQLGHEFRAAWRQLGADRARGELSQRARKRRGSARARARPPSSREQAHRRQPGDGSATRRAATCTPGVTATSIAIPAAAGSRPTVRVAGARSPADTAGDSAGVGTGEPATTRTGTGGGTATTRPTTGAGSGTATTPADDEFVDEPARSRRGGAIGGKTRTTNRSTHPVAAACRGPAAGSMGRVGGGARRARPVGELGDGFRETGPSSGAR